jgi:carbonic anhydrase
VIHRDEEGTMNKMFAPDNLGPSASACASRAPVSRRSVLGAGAVGSAGALLAAAGLDLAALRPALAQSVLSPDAALKQMMDGNQRFIDRKLISLDEDLAELKQNTAEKQEPFAALLSCADSRVPTELVFDQSIGHLFVTRVAGNIASSDVIASLEYGAVVLGTKVIMVMGHGNCGAVTASIDAKAAPGQISALYRYIRPAVDQAGPDLDATIRANAKIQAKILAEASPVLADLIKKGALRVVASYYDLVTGKVTLLS